MVRDELRDTTSTCPSVFTVDFVRKLVPLTLSSRYANNSNKNKIVYYATREESKRFVIVKLIFLSCRIRYFFPDFSWKGSIRVRAMARVKLTIFNQFTHNQIINNGCNIVVKKRRFLQKKIWKKRWRNKVWWKKMLETILTNKLFNQIDQSDTIFTLLEFLGRNREK